MTDAPALAFRGVSIAYPARDGWLDAVRDVDLVVPRGVTYGLVGESGSGKSTLALAALGALGGGGRMRAGRIELAGSDLSGMRPAELRAARRSLVRLVPQDPGASLNPSLTVGRQLEEGLAARGERRRGPAARRVHEALASVGLPDPERVAASYPHQLSGGMQQRVVIAMALAGEPELLVMDEPTTNLDVTTEATILDLVRELVRERGTSVLYVSHSLAVVAQLCRRVAVLYAGELVEDADVADLYGGAVHPYTHGLLASLPRLGQDRRERPLRPIDGRIPAPGERPEGCVFAPRCPVVEDACRAERPALTARAALVVGAGEHRARCLRAEAIAAGTLDPLPPALAPSAARDALDDDSETVLDVTDLAKRFPVRRGLLEVLRRAPQQQVRAVSSATLRVRRGRTLGLVGESGSGKSTIARCVIGLIEPSEGSVQLLGAALAPGVDARERAVLRRLQLVFQHSGEALNPYLSVGDNLRRPLRRLAGLRGEELERRVLTLLESVTLPPEYARRSPAELSGGEQQRVAIARAFASAPDLLVFDESVSGLDVSVQAAILALLTRLQDERDSAYVFISHDLAVVSYLADEVAVAYLGHLVETGPTRAVLEPPYHPYTEALLSAVPVPDPGDPGARVRLAGDVPSPVDVPSGCPFHTRCPRVLGEVCATQVPPLQEDERGARIACHIPLDELRVAQASLAHVTRGGDIA